MRMEEEKEIILQPQDAYGLHNPDFVKEISKEYFPTDEAIEKGMYYVMVLDDGRQMPVKISEVTDEKVTIDLNHPLAGKTLTFKIKIIEINQ
jgi:FKBP-type peptidyl-prolyl cis-trans isomerase 2